MTNERQTNFIWFRSLKRCPLCNQSMWTNGSNSGWLCPSGHEIGNVPEGVRQRILDPVSTVFSKSDPKYIGNFTHRW